MNSNPWGEAYEEYENEVAEENDPWNQAVEEFQKEKKLNKKESVAAGALEAVVAPMFLAGKLGEKLSVQKPESFSMILPGGVETELKLPRETEAELIQKPIEEMSFAEIYALSDDDILPPSMIRPSKKQLAESSESAKDPSKFILGNIPKSETQTGRRLRTATSAAVLSGPFGLIPAIASVSGSQAGQTIRETFGKDGEVGGFGETVAFLTDLLFSLGTGLGVDVAKGTIKAGKEAAKVAAKNKEVSSVFRKATDFLDTANTKTLIQGEKKVLDNVVKDFTQKEIQELEKTSLTQSAKPFDQLKNVSVETLEEGTKKAYVDTQLNLISPIDTSLEAGSRSIQDATNKTFKANVIDAEKKAYEVVRKEAKDLSGQAPKTLKEAKALRKKISSTEPTPDQQEAISFLDTLIKDLEETIPGKTVPKSLHPSGAFVSEARQIPSSTTPRTRSANDLIKMVQSGNNAVNYDSQLRLQSHRLKNIVNKLREETGTILDQKPLAKKAWVNANDLHGKNAKVWNTKNMRSVRFGENPERIISSNKTASNLTNFKKAVGNEDLSRFVERMVIQQITESGSHDANSIALRKLSSALSPQAYQSAQELIRFKNPSSVIGAREAFRNKLIKEAASSIVSGQRPTTILKNMQTLKGYNFVKDTFSKTPNGKEIFRSLEKLFIDDLFESVIDSTGNFDFSKAKEILKNRNIREVVNHIGGKDMVKRFSDLEKASINFMENNALYKSPEKIGLIKQATTKIVNTGVVAAALHSLGVPYSVIAGMGLIKAGASISKSVSKMVMRKILQNPNAVEAIRKLSVAKTAKDASKQISRLVILTQDYEEEDRKKKN
jgi:hypothetical protein